jgi:hypothetical protein
MAAILSGLALSAKKRGVPVCPDQATGAFFLSPAVFTARTTPVIGAKSSPMKNHNQELRLVTCAQYAQKMPKRKLT